MAQRLNKEDWLRAGFAALTDAGPKALKAEVLARRLGTTKGSFYWHFADVPSFHAAMMTHWEARAYSDIVAALEAEATPQMRLRQLGQVAAGGAPQDYGGYGAEPAIRAWARDNDLVQEMLTRVDQKRMEYLKALLADIGLTNSELVRLLYAAFVGMEDLSSRDGMDNGPALGTLVDLILALYED